MPKGKKKSTNVLERPTASPPPDLKTVADDVLEHAAIPARETIPRSEQPFPRAVAFRCYMGHVTYSWPDAACLPKCLNCGAVAQPEPASVTDMCLCGHFRNAHIPHCRTCGLLDDGEGKNKRANCPSFNKMS